MILQYSESEVPANRNRRPQHNLMVEWRSVLQPVTRLIKTFLIRPRLFFPRFCLPFCLIVWCRMETRTIFHLESSSEWASICTRRASIRSFLLNSRPSATAINSLKKIWIMYKYREMFFHFFSEKDFYDLYVSERGRGFSLTTELPPLSQSLLQWSASHRSKVGDNMSLLIVNALQLWVLLSFLWSRQKAICPCGSWVLFHNIITQRNKKVKLK